MLTDTALDYADLFSITLLSMSQIPSDDDLGKSVQIENT